MIVFYLLLRGFTLFQVEDVSGDSHLAISSIEESLGRQRSLAVSYAIHTEFTELGKTGKIEPPPDFAVTWLRMPNKESLLIRYQNDPDRIAKKWFYDGKTVHEWTYERKSKDLNHVAISQGEVRQQAKHGNTLAFILGLETYLDIDGGLLSVLRQSRLEKLVTVRRVPGFLEIDLGPLNIRSFKYRFRLNVEPDFDFRIRSWQIEALPPDKPAQLRFQFNVDEFQEVKVQDAERMVWFPLKARETTLGTVSTIDVKSVEVNPILSDSLFTPPTLPLGAIINEVPSTPGEQVHQRVHGGESARKLKLDEPANEANAESKRTRRQLPYDATPPTGGISSYFWILGICLVLIGVTCWTVRRVFR